jgi:hypothetical protein
MSLLPAVVVQFVYDRQWACVVATLVLMLGYVGLYKKMMTQFGR